ncbi:MAG: peptide chain release factor 2 [Patescibacteria group bacterium]|nr:peptide chain release factor 2 [Patescibacteria group bacterium]
MKEAELINKLKELNIKISEAGSFFDIGKKIDEVKKLDKEIAEKDFWSDTKKAKAISQKTSDLKSEIDIWQKLKKEIDDLSDLARTDQEDKSVNLREEVEKEYEKLKKEFKKLEFQLLFGEKNDVNNAILAVHAGTGGVDAMDWTQMLLRMYLRYCERKGFKTKIVDETFGSEAGVKSAVVEISGKYAYGNLKSENGVHRLVRISPFDAEAMRHTSFALVEVIPEIAEDAEIEIKPEDLKIDTFRASGHGGQNIQKTESAVRITHLPTKITVVCQSERSQAQNKERALKILKSKLFQLSQAIAEAEKKQLRGEYSEAAWGNQIRSYVLQPYHLVKDHRTEYEEGDVDSVLDGKLDGFVGAYLKLKR